jgi:guanine nucleotide-binding protein G(i) subunit alpha
VDTGGERSERRKWIHCFEGATAVIFFAALSEYNLKLKEDNSTNRMHESLALFDEVCNSDIFMKIPMILFLNKEDIFSEQIEQVHLNVCFEDYTGPKKYEESLEFIVDKFKKINLNPHKNIHIHTTCAIDTDRTETTFNAVRDTILRAILGDLLFLV